MPPKKGGGGGASKKSEQKKADKVVQDKTFGLKNKNKSKSVQKYIQGVQSQVKGSQSKKEVDAAFQAKKKQQDELERKKLEGELFKPAVVQTKVPLGVDPKSVVCEFYKKGLCTKGDKCKFSHNVDQGRKSEKIDLYTDRREGENEQDGKEADTMDKWDQNKLETVVDQKQGEANKQIKTKIVCKYFLEAIEIKKYGWFWECPNGGDKCIYQHSLPPGFVLKSSKKEEEDEEEPISIEEQIEEERAKLIKRTPLTLERFLKWKEDKKKEREEEEKEIKAKRESDIKSGKAMRSGREMFIYNPDLFVDDDDVLDTTELPEEKEDEGPVIRIEVSGTSISLSKENGDEEGEEMENNGKEEESDEEGENNGGEGAVEIQENLFVEEDIPDDIDEATD